MNRELSSIIGTARAIDPAVLAASTNGQLVDTLGYDSVTFVAAVGAIAGAGNMTLKVQEGDLANASDQADVAATDITVAFATPLVTNTTQRIGYRGGKRYVRLVATLNSGTSVAVGAVAILAHAQTKPVAAP